MPAPPQRGITLRFLAEPTDVNFGGKVHGGAVMKWIDQVGYTCAAGWTGTYCVTVYLGGLHFLGPIHVGEVRPPHRHSGAPVPSIWDLVVIGAGPAGAAAALATVKERVQPDLQGFCPIDIA